MTGCTHFRYLAAVCIDNRAIHIAVGVRLGVNITASAERLATQEDYMAYHAEGAKAAVQDITA